jgi:hypothetical protein
MNFSKEIQGKYQFSGNTFSRCVKNNPFDKIEVEVGDAKQQNFFPQAKVMRWDNETNLSVRLITSKGSNTVSTESEKIVWSNGKEEAHFYEINPNEEHKEGAFEFEVVLGEKPLSNVVEFSIETKGITFSKQLSLLEETPRPDWVTVSETEAYNEKGELAYYRPENVVGSYALFHESNKGDYSKVGGKDYKTGKFGHIFRPKIIDSKGNWVWGELNVKDNLLTVTIPEEFLNKAIYPIIVDPTFGYTVSGASGTITWDFIGTKFTPNSSGVATEISVYIWSQSDIPVGANVNVGIYNDNSGVIGTNITNSTEIFIEPGEVNDWVDFAINNTNVTEEENYWLVAQQSVKYLMIYNDSEDGFSSYYDTDHTFNDWSTPSDGSYIDDRRYSIYATYTDGSIEWYSPRSTGKLYNNWVYAKNAYISDDNYTEVWTENSEQDYYNFNISIPTGESIDGITLRVEGNVDSAPGSYDLTASLSFDGGNTFTTTKTLNVNSDSDTLIDFGGVADTWGRSWSESEFSNTNFLIKLKTENWVGAITPRIDHIEVMVTTSGGSETTASKTVSGKANIVTYGDWSEVWGFEVPPKTVEAKANIRAPQTQEIISKSNILNYGGWSGVWQLRVVPTRKNISGKASILQFLQGGIEARGRIEKTIKQSIVSKAFLNWRRSKFISGAGNLIKVGNWSQVWSFKVIPRRRSISGKASILKFLEGGIEAKARITRSRIKTISSKGFLNWEQNKSISSLANIIKVGGWSTIWSFTVPWRRKYVSVLANIKVLGNKKTISSQGNIKKTYEHSVNVHANIFSGKRRRISAKASIYKIILQTVSVKGTVQHRRIKSFFSLANIKATIDQNILGVGRIERTEQVGLSSRARIQITLNKTLIASANIKNTLSKGIIGKGAILREFITSISSLGRIQRTEENVISGKTRIERTENKSLWSKASIYKTKENTITAKAELLITTTQTTLARANVLKWSSKQLEAKARIVRILVTEIVNERTVVNAENVVTPFLKYREINENRVRTNEVKGMRGVGSEILSPKVEVVEITPRFIKRTKYMTSKGYIRT